MDLIPYGQDWLFYTPLPTKDDGDFIAGVTIAAGDVKLFSDQQIATNLTAEAVAFTSGSEEPVAGDTLDGATSGESATFMFAVTTSGTWGGGDAAGVLFVKSTSGNFQAENLNINGGSSNVLTIGADFTAGLFGAIGSGLYAVAITAAEAQCKRGVIPLIDTATKEWEDQAITFETYGHASSAHEVLPANVKQISDDATAADNLESACDNYSATRGLAGTAVPAAAADAPGGLVISDGGGFDVDGLRASITGGAYSLDTDANGRLRIVDGTGTGELDTSGGLLAGVAGTKKTFDDLNDISSADANAACDTALTDYDAPTYDELEGFIQLALRSDAAIATDRAALLSAINADEGSGAGDYDNTADGVEALRDWIGDGSNLTEAGGDGDHLTEAGGDGDHLTEAGGDGDHLTEAGGTGDQFTALPTEAEIQAAITGGAYSFDTDANGRVRIVDGTGVGEINTASGAIVQVDQLGSQAKADVNAELVDVIETDTHAQPGQGTPPATTSYSVMLRYVYKAWRNKKTQDSSEFALYNDDAATVDQKASVSDAAGTFTLGEITTGP